MLAGLEKLLEETKVAELRELLHLALARLVANG
jgi:hypothetical protein